MQSLVTGCAGFIGSQLTEALLAAGHSGARGRRVHRLLRPRDQAPQCRRRRVLGSLRADRGRPLHHRHRSPARRCRHGVPPRRSARRARVVVRRIPAVRGADVLATQRLLEAVRDQPVRRLVYASSSSVYGNALHTRGGDRPAAPRTPRTRVTKLAAEHLCSLYAENWELPTVSLRYFSVYGTAATTRHGLLTLLRRGARGRPIPIFGTGEQIRDFTYSGDVVDATIAASVADVAPGPSAMSPVFIGQRARADPDAGRGHR